MQAPEDFLLEYFSARNALYKRFQRETEAFEREFCQDFLICDPRTKDYDGERILEITWHQGCAKVTTTGHYKGKTAARLRYVLVGVEDGWFISDLEGECPICKGGATHTRKPQLCEAGRGCASDSASPPECQVCKGAGWLSSKQMRDGLLNE